MIASLIGKALHGVHAGEKHLLTHEDEVASTPQVIEVRSAAFENGGAIPQRHAGEGVGEDVSPPLAWSGVPEGTGGLLLMVQDPAAPLPRPIVHCLATMKPDIREIPEGGLKDGSAPAGLTLWKGTMGDVGYIGPKPVPGHGVHTYVFQVVALKTIPAFEDTPSHGELLKAIDGQVLGWGRLDGTYERP